MIEPVEATDSSLEENGLVTSRNVQYHQVPLRHLQENMSRLQEGPILVR